MTSEPREGTRRYAIADAFPAFERGTGAMLVGRVEAAQRPLAGAWVRLLDPHGEFVGELVTADTGAFRFYVTPGRWVLRVLSPRGVAELPVETRAGEVTEAEVRLVEQFTGSLEIIQVATLSLGDRSYLITDGSVAVAVDPQRDIERITSVLESHELRLDAVMETHLHNDYVTGGLELARRLDAVYAVPAGPTLGFDAQRVRDGDELSSGAMRVQVIGTPGHTDHHVAYAFALRDGPPRLACTGGSLLYGTTGRTDLMGARSAEQLAHRQFHSVRHLAQVLPDDTVILPTHGFGSFCAASAASVVERSTLTRERAVNPVFTLAEDAFVTSALTGLEPYPAYYRHMAGINAAGPAFLARSAAPHTAGVAELADRVADGQWVVDVRPRAGFAHTHLRGAVNFDARGSLATYLGWLVPLDAPVALLAADTAELDSARRELARIGFDHPVAVAIGDPPMWAGPEWLASYPRADFAALAIARAGRPLVVLDVRSASEWRSGHLPEARHVPLPELPAALPALADAEIWVHCRSGFRAAVAASLLAATGRRVVLVDDAIEHARLVT